MAVVAQDAQATIQSIAARLSKQVEGAFVDFRIKCKSREWKVHRVILAMHSPALEAACGRNFKEATQGYIDFPEEDQECIEALVSYLYNFEYDLGLASDDTSFHVKMVVLADSWDLPRLQAFAVKSFKQSMTISPYNQEAFCQTLKYAYATGNPTKEIRQHMINLMIEHDSMQGVIKDTNSPFELAMRENANIAADMAVALQLKLMNVAATCVNKRFKCPACTKSFSSIIPDTPAQEKCDFCGESLRGSAWQKHIVY